jgi:hypothetical protein
MELKFYILERYTDSHDIWEAPRIFLDENEAIRKMKEEFHEHKANYFGIEDWPDNCEKDGLRCYFGNKGTSYYYAYIIGVYDTVFKHWRVTEHNIRFSFDIWVLMESKNNTINEPKYFHNYDDAYKEMERRYTKLFNEVGDDADCSLHPDYACIQTDCDNFDWRISKVNF